MSYVNVTCPHCHNFTAVFNDECVVSNFTEYGFSPVVCRSCARVFEAYKNNDKIMARMEFDPYEDELIERAIDSAECRVNWLKWNGGKAEDQIALMDITIKALKYYRDNR